VERELREAQNEKDQLCGCLDNAEKERLTAENGHHESVTRVAQLEQLLCQTENEKDCLSDRLNGVEKEKLAAENAHCESIARVAELEQSVVSRDEQLQEAAERWSQLLQQLNTLLRTSCHAEATSLEMDSDDGLQTTDSESGLIDAVRRLVQTLHDKSAVRCLHCYYLELLYLSREFLEIHKCSSRISCSRKQGNKSTERETSKVFRRCQGSGK